MLRVSLMSFREARHNFFAFAKRLFAGRRLLSSMRGA
jgi:hypothetical protein